MEFNHDAEKKPVVLMTIDDFICISHGALHASMDKDYIKQFPITAFQIATISDKINNMRKFIEEADVMSLVEDGTDSTHDQCYTKQEDGEMVNRRKGVDL